jgi:hypothetical protein
MVDMMPVDPFFFFLGCKMLSSTFPCRFQNCKIFNMIYFLLPSFELQNFLFKKWTFYPLVLRALNFEDEISIRRGKCNTLKKVNLFIRQKLSHRSNQQR